jgi:hypothetical protein
MSIDYDKLIVGHIYRVTVENWFSGTWRTALLRRVEEGDCDWRVVSEGEEPSGYEAELGHSWTVIRAEDTGTKDPAVAMRGQ